MNSFKNINKIIGNIFEKEYVLFTRNATTAIWLILKSLEIYNKKIIVPNNICFSVICSIYLSNNSDVWYNVDFDIAGYQWTHFGTPSHTLPCLL